MKRFYKQVESRAAEGGWQIALDGRMVRTPGRAPLLLPTEQMAQAIAAEWRAQGDDIEPLSMPATGFANAAIDQVAPDPADFAATIARYAETDLLCYRAEGPAALVARQAAEWDFWLDWARRRYDVAFRTTVGIVHVAQPPETVTRLSNAVTTYDPFTLAPLSTLVTLTGSLVLGLAITEADADPDVIWNAAELDALWQAEMWGEDAQAQALAAAHRREFDAAVAFCRMART
ncbi:MAG: ATP12 family protein [Sphingobium sp.]|uniref:ATP12 family chaperone protein n=1 Tax=Sphingobium sp. TaxID=1912891 RepID=UPI0029A2CE4F|nr:ATP12 family protein [Sphingobium sp.]MDX3908342.1 ATP12 family protein [Sphingobium sp.]